MKNKKIVIGIMGEKGSGKGTAAEYFIANHQAAYFRVSTILKRTLESLHLDPSRENFNKLALALKKNFGPQVIINSLIDEIEKSGEEVAIADGIRMKGDDEPFRKKYGKNFHLVYVTADVKNRYERTKKRKEKAGEDRTTFKKFLIEEKNPTEKDIPKIGKKAEFIIDNNGTPEELKNQIIETAKKIFS